MPSSPTDVRRMGLHPVDDGDVVRVYACPHGHVSSVARFPDARGVRRCFWCPSDTVAKDATIAAVEDK